MVGFPSDSFNSSGEAYDWGGVGRIAALFRVAKKQIFSLAEHFHLPEIHNKHDEMARASRDAMIVARKIFLAEEGFGAVDFSNETFRIIFDLFAMHFLRERVYAEDISATSEDDAYLEWHEAMCASMFQQFDPEACYEDPGVPFDPRCWDVSFHPAYNDDQKLDRFDAVADRLQTVTDMAQSVGLWSFISQVVDMRAQLGIAKNPGLSHGDGAVVWYNRACPN